MVHKKYITCPNSKEFLTFFRFCMILMISAKILISKVLEENVVYFTELEFIDVFIFFGDT